MRNIRQLRVPRALLLATCATGLFALNAWIGWRLFWLDYSIHMGSVEGTFVSIARYMRDHGPDLGWWPLWYCGMPFENTYQPLIPALTAVLSASCSLNAARAYHMVLGFAYALGPVTLFVLAAGLTRRIVWSLAAGLLYSLFSPSAWLAPLIRDDLGGLFLARRLHTAMVYADGPHVAALSLIPAVILALHYSIEKRSLRWMALGAMAVSAVILTNLPGAIALSMAAGAYGIVYCRRGADWLRLAATGLAGWLLALCWVPPSTFATVLSNMRWMEPAGRWDGKRALQVAVALAAAGLIARLLRNLGVSKPLQFFVLLALIPGAVVLGKYWAGITLVAQPTRFQLILEMGVVLAFVFAAAEYLSRSKVVLTMLSAAAVCLLIVQIVNYRSFARTIIRPVDIRSRSEFKVATWMEQYARGARILAPGSDAFWLNAFTDTPQITGCCDQGLLMRAVKMAYYAIGSDDGAGDRGAEISITWLRALGAQFVVVSGPNSTEVYKDFAHPGKFRGVLREVWRDGDDVIYEIPRRSPGLAHVIRRHEMIAKVPENGVLTEPLLSYVSAIEDPARPVAAITWQNPETASIHATVSPGDVLSIQVPWHPGWRALVNGQMWPVHADALGFMVIDPQSSGELHITLRYSRGAERWLIRSLTLLLGAGALWWRVRGRNISDS